MRLKKYLAVAGFGSLLVAGLVLAAGADGQGGVGVPGGPPPEGGGRPGAHGREHGHGPGPGRGPGLAHMREALGLTEAQVGQIRKIHMDGRKAAIRRRADIQIARMDLHELMAAPTLDEKAVNVKVKELADLQGAALRSRVDEHLAFRKVLTPEQLEKFRNLGPMGHPGGERRMRPGRRSAGDGPDDGEDGPDAGGPRAVDESLTGVGGR